MQASMLVFWALGYPFVAALDKCQSQSFTDFAAALGPILSPGASINFPGSDKFTNATTRYSAYGAPGFAVTVDVATEDDVANTVKAANTHQLPFLATSGHHGATISLGRLRCGVNINLRALSSVKVLEGGQMALIGGGTLTVEVTEGLWAHKKWTVTGICECTSLLGPGLGGGHGWNQGRYGLGLDQIVEANLVLGDGSRIVVSEDSPHADLFWGLRGAGHNFGIVTSVKYKIYDVPEGNTWVVSKYTYTQDKLEALFGVLDSFVADGAQPVELRHWTNFIRMPTIDPVHAVFVTWLIYEGTPEQAAPYTAKLEALGPATKISNTTAYPGLAVLTGNDRGAKLCAENGDHVLRFPIDLRGFNVTAHRAAYTIFDETSRTYPGLSGAIMLNEGYSVRAVQAVPAGSTAYPDRFNNLLLSPSFRITPSDHEDGGAEMDRIATEAGLKMRQTLFEGGGSPDLYTYVNYGLGLETLENYYGHEEWRLARLRTLKAKYDPGRRFSFYAPIE
ncbi:FAD-dependent oxygenase [Apiospora arundinis]|uniref:FAD-dependent oxygenase n=1 Tax=Apiospora arundinis TaxID=335852 RepID=A0ABR2I078_9PEZI